MPRLNSFKDIAVLTLQGWMLCPASSLVFSGSLTSGEERLVDSLLSAKTEDARMDLLRNKAAVTPQMSMSGGERLQGFCGSSTFSVDPSPEE